MLAASGLVGLLLGLFGGGGSILAVPMFVLVLGVQPSTAVGMSLAIVAATSTVTALVQRRRGLVRPRVALLFGGSGAVAAFGSAHLTYAVPQSVLMLTFAMVLIAAGVWMASRSQREASRPVTTDAGVTRRVPILQAMLAGTTVGAATGFLGVGGGFLVVPALVGIAKLDLRRAIGTSLAVVAMNSVAGLSGHLAAGDLDLRGVAGAAGAAILGGLLGERLGRGLGVDKLRGGLAGVLIVAGLMVGASAGGVVSFHT